MASNFSPERSYIEGRADRLSEAEERLFVRLIPERNEKAIRIEDEAFSFYDPAKRASDRAEMERRRLHFIEENKHDQKAEAHLMRGKLFEAMIEDQIEQSDWMGPHAEVIVPCDYDDYVNKVDAILEFDRPGSLAHLALGVDITADAESLSKKFAGIKRSIENGTASVVDYFKSSHFTGRLEFVPQVVVGADRQTMNEVADLILRFRTLRERPKPADEKADAPRVKEFKKVREQLAEHPMQFKVLMAIRTQLESFAAYARANGQERLAKIYENANAIVKEVLKSKELPDNMEDMEYKDDVYGSILRYARELARPAKS